MKSTWIVVANHACARIFTAENRSGPLTEITTLVHGEGRLHDREMTSDLPGKIKGRDGSGGHAFEQGSDPKQHEAENFVRLLAGHIEAARNRHEFAQLLLVADPGILGLLRDLLSESSKRLVCFELVRNLATANATDIRAHLPGFLPELGHDHE